MRSSKPGGDKSTPPHLLNAAGDIDLTGRGAPPPQSSFPTMQPSADAWLADRDRRSLLPPRTAPAVAEEAADAERAPLHDIHREIADRFGLGDYAAALHAAELQLGVDADDEGAQRYAVESRDRLEARYTAWIGSLDDVFNLAVPTAKVKWLGLDPQAAFLLSLVDGQTTVAEVLERCQLGRLEALRVFTELIDANAIQRVA